MKVLKRLFRMMVPYTGTLAISAGFLIARAGLELVPPLIQRTIVDDVIVAGDTARLGVLIGLFVLVLALKSGAAAGDMYVRHALGQRIIYDLRVRLYAILQKLSLGFYEKQSTGELMSRVTNDVNALEGFITHGSALTLVDLLRLVGAAVVLVVLDWRLALLVMIPIPILAVALRHFNTQVRPVYRKVRRTLGDINARLQESLAGIHVIQAYNQEDRELERFAGESEQYREARVEGIRAWTTFFPAMRFVAQLGTVIILGVGGMMVVNGTLSLGTLVAFLAYVLSFYQPINRLTEIDNIIQEAIAAGERVFELWDQESDIEDKADAQPIGAIEGAVSLDHVRFRYGTGEEVLHDVSFSVEPGQVFALVGPSGAGKTSIANLICRFYDPIEGSIFVDGKNVRDITIRSLRSQVGVVLQNAFLFNTTIRENISFGRPNATEEQMIESSKAAYAHEFIMELPHGYDTEIGERGIRLSGGQQQRIALARTILTDPRILVLDEATSSVDAEAEYLIQKALVSVLEGRTALIIAHRLSTVQRADQIIVLEHGRIVQMGTHDELMDQGGLYSQLYRRQIFVDNEVSQA